MLLEREPDIDIVAACSNGRDVVKAVKELQPDLLFLDIQMPYLTGFEVLCALRDARVDALTLGQYLRPSLRHLPVERYLEPAEFDDLGREAEAMGFRHVASGPLVRSSFHADTALGILGAMRGTE